MTKIIKRTKMNKLPKAEVVITKDEERISIGGSIKLTRKMPGDVFVSIEASCNLSTSAATPSRDATLHQNAVYVRKALVDHLRREIRMVQKEVEG